MMHEPRLTHEDTCKIARDIQQILKWQEQGIVFVSGCSMCFGLMDHLSFCPLSKETQNMKELTDINTRIETLDLAIADAEARIASNPTDTHYVGNQQDRIHEWATEKYTLNRRKVEIENPTPVTGVIGHASIEPEAFDEAIREGINLSAEEALDDHRKECTDARCRRGGHGLFTEDWESMGSDTMLIGDWVPKDGLWNPDITKSYSAIVRETVVQVVWSKAVIRVKSFCSPCYLGQADLDSGVTLEGGILTYTLPDDMLAQGDE